MAEMLAIHGLDLTEHSKRHQGKCLTETAAIQFDGRSHLLAHGREMPILGLSLGADQNVELHLKSVERLMIGLPLANVTVYLDALQTEQCPFAQRLTERFCGIHPHSG